MLNQPSMLIGPYAEVNKVIAKVGAGKFDLIIKTFPSEPGFDPEEHEDNTIVFKSPLHPTSHICSAGYAWGVVLDYLKGLNPLPAPVNAPAPEPTPVPSEIPLTTKPLTYGDLKMTWATYGEVGGPGWLDTDFSVLEAKAMASMAANPPTFGPVDEFLEPDTDFS